MKVGIIGGGISGCFFAIKLKEEHPDYQITIIEHNDKLLKKIYATGNGKCNFANAGDLKDKYSNEEFALPIINEYNYKDISSYFRLIGVENILEDDLAYPISKSAQTVALMLLRQIDALKIDVKLSSKLIDYKKESNSYKVILDKEELLFDRLVFACGGKSSPNLGSDGSIFDVMKKHDYKIKELSPSLCPIKVYENTKLVEGVRNEVKVSIYQKDNLIHEEVGELLFKDNGLSGIVIFNATHYINKTNKKDIKLHIDFAFNYSKRISGEDYISYVHPKLAKYLQDNKLDIHNVIYTFKDFYDYSTSQVSSGGIIISEVNDSLESNKEKGIYLIGEILDVDAICGGYNMMWAFASAVRVARRFK